jgi:hypothetical protein
MAGRWACKAQPEKPKGLLASWISGWEGKEVEWSITFTDQSQQLNSSHPRKRHGTSKGLA